MMEFEKKAYVTEAHFREITTIRVSCPEMILEAAGKRKRRAQFVPDGRMNIVAADHPARGSVAIGEEPFAMAGRYELLARLVSALQSEWVDGVLASMDILEELLILNELMRDEGRTFLEEKLLIASLNRGGLPGAAWELDDPVTGTDADTCEKYGIDAAKMLLRIDVSSPDVLKTIRYCAEGVREMNRLELPMILEPLPVERVQNSYRVVREPDPLIRLIGVTSALGNSSRNLWLKIPYTREFSRVAASTTLPIVILGGDRSGQLEDHLTEIAEALTSGHQVRGVMYGRNVLYPQELDPGTVAAAFGKLVHGPTDPHETIEQLKKELNL